MQMVSVRLVSKNFNNNTLKGCDSNQNLWTIRLTYIFFSITTKPKTSWTRAQGQIGQREHKFFIFFYF